ncbi:hypothetical protein C0993_009345, partial [Termitomyces sp. T159_Od127]
FVPAFWALKDGRITPTELDELEKQSTTILITAFAILISTVVQAPNHGISNYHASIVLNLSWMNNTNLFIYFLLYIYHRVNLSKDEFDEEIRVSASHVPPNKGLARWIYVTKETLRNLIGFSHDVFRSGLTNLSKDEFNKDLEESADTEMAIKNNINEFQLAGEAKWTFGQTLAVLLLLVAFHDLIGSILEKHAKQLDEQLLEACKNGEIKSVKSLLRRGARKNVQGMHMIVCGMHLQMAIQLL